MEMGFAWLISHWRWRALNLFAVSTFVFVLTQGSTGWDADTFDPMLESGKWAIRFLLICLSMTPLNTYFGWSSAIKLRKSAGLWAFGFASVHVLFYIREVKLEWLTIDMPFYLALGLIGVSILSALALTSNRRAMQRLGKNWKRLHRLVYFAGIAVVTHSMLAMTMSKKIMIRDPQAEYELKIYVAALSVLLAVRIPLIRQWLRQIPILLKRHRKLVTPIAAHNKGAELLPKIHGRESSVSVEPTFIIIPNEMPKLSDWVHLSGPFGRMNVPLKSHDGDISVETPNGDEGEIQETIAN